MKRRKKRNKFRVVSKERSVTISLFIAFTFLVVTMMLVYRIVFKGGEYKKLADAQIINQITIDAKRGKILDRNGNNLAVSGDVYRVDLDLVEISKTIKSKANAKDGESEDHYYTVLINELANILEVEKIEVENALKSTDSKRNPRTSSVLARQISKEQADRIKTLDYYGVLIFADTKRYYPNNEFSSYVVGNVNSDGKGQNGIELYYDSILSGIPGMRIAEFDRYKEQELPINEASFTEPIDGKDIILTIDEKIQYFAEKAAKKALNDYKADSVSILVTEPNTNEILALATNPDYNPNTPHEGFEPFKGETEEEKIQQMWRNKVVSDTYEPGSTFKIITTAAALEEGIAGGDEKYYCEGFKMFGDTKIRCWKREGHGEQTFSQILENSCNVGFMEVGAKLGKEKLYTYIDKFGFGKPTGIDIIGESVGIVKKPNEMNETDLPTISFGQTNTVSMIQLLTGFNACINGGYLVTPHLMKEVANKTDNGTMIITDSYKGNKNQIISEDTSKVIREILEKVVSGGTGKPAYVDGFRVAGKTGTAEMVDIAQGGYGEGRIASFIAAAPADNPKISILVTIENPKSGSASGSGMAAPVVKEILESVYSYKNVDEVDFISGGEKSIIMPEVRGLSIEDAKKKLADEGLEVKCNKTEGFVKSIDALPGSVVKSGSVVAIKLAKNNNNIDKDVIVPSLVGYDIETAKSVLDKVGLKAKFEGSEGIVLRQSVNSGVTVKKGETIKLNLEE